MSWTRTASSSSLRTSWRRRAPMEPERRSRRSGRSAAAGPDRQASRLPPRTEVSMLQRRDASFFIVVGLLPFALAGCTHADSADDPRTQSPLVRVVTVEAAVQTDRSFTGIVAARVQSDLGFRVPGKVLERLVDTGQAVKRGQPLMRINPTDLRLAARAHAEG